MPIPALSPAPSTLQPLRGLRVLNLALNVPGPVALLRLRAMGAVCIKAEPPPPKTAAGVSGDPMSQYSPGAYTLLQEGLQVLQLDLKSPAGQAELHAQLAQADVLLTAFRPSALSKLGLDWGTLHARYPKLSQVAIVGAPGARAEEAVLPLLPCRRGVGNEGMKMQYVKSNMRERQVQMIIKDNLITHD